VHEVIKTSTAVEREVCTSDGSWFATRILPYWAEGNAVAGAVITFMDITHAKTLEAELRAAGADPQDRPDQDQ